MKVINKTKWRTTDLKRILQRCAEQEFDDGSRRKKLVVTVVYTRTGKSSGYAWYNSNHSVVRIMSPMQVQRRKLPLSEVKLAFAKVACHEFAHNRGMRHGKMPAYYRWKDGWQVYVAWAADFPLDVLRKTTANVEDRVKQRRAYALAMFQRAQVRVKRAKTLLAKWAKKVKYYERQAAASQKEPHDNHGDS